MKRLISLLVLLPLLGAAQQQESISVQFDFAKFYITEQAKARLDSFIAATPTGRVTIELHGHCDAVGNNSNNDRLSVKRVMTIRNYLINNHFPASCFSVTTGHGKRQPVNSNATEPERLQNRRVDIMITRYAHPGTVTASGNEKNISEQLEDTAVKSGSKLVLKNIIFIGARHQLLPESYPVLQDLLKAMTKNKQLVIEIQGHICCLPGNVDGYDEETGTNNLSELRAKAVAAYLTEHGIGAERLSYAGLGHSQPIYSYPERSETEKKLNRRVEIKIISK